MSTARSTAPPTDVLDKVPAPPSDPLVELRAQVHADAQHEPEEYLADTIVPGGGE